jgi:hypothetical protein
MSSFIILKCEPKCVMSNHQVILAGNSYYAAKEFLSEIQKNQSTILELSFVFQDGEDYTVHHFKANRLDHTSEFILDIVK